MRCSVLPQQLRVSLSALPEGIVPPGHDSPQADRSAQHLQEVFRRKVRHLPGEPQQLQLIRAVPRHESRFFRQRCQQLRRRFRTQHLQRMPVKRACPQPDPVLPCVLFSGFQKGLVSPVHAVKRSQGEHPFFFCLPVPDYSHLIQSFSTPGKASACPGQ